MGLQVASLGGGSHTAMAMEEIKAEQEALAEEEERRIFYVAMTRAEQRLIVSGATDTVDVEPAEAAGRADGLGLAGARSRGEAAVREEPSRAWWTACAACC